VPSRRVAPRWGDWHFGQDLAAALRRRGHEVRLQTLDEADSVASRCCDVQLVLRGLNAVERTEGQGHALWIISHPERVTREEVDAADVVFVASEHHARTLRRVTDTPVEVLLQATDPGRFRPHAPDPRYQHPVVVVAKTRSVLRPIVADAIDAGLRPAIFGSGWDAFVDPALIVADHVDNSLLPIVYSSAGVVLNDHWETMRREGFVSNRIFDVLACETPVISDSVVGLTEIFGDAVPIADNPNELRGLVETLLTDPRVAKERARAARHMILSCHTFDHRAGALSEAFERHGLGPRP
jgi:glycosyltransferase involved in cell wall biosynthesis